MLRSHKLLLQPAGLDPMVDITIDLPILLDNRTQVTMHIIGR